MRVEPARRLRGELVAPGDKSISHRAAILGAMAAEPVRIRGYLDAEDTRSTLAAVHALGALVTERDGEVVVRGTGLRHASEPAAPIDVGNAGTLLRLLPGWLAAQEGRSFVLDGDASIRRRPVDRITEPLRRMGARLEAREGRLPPLTVHGTRLRGTTYASPVASAQVKSCLLLAGLAADGRTTVVEPMASRDHTERLLARAGAPVARDGTAVSVSGIDELLLDGVDVPGDPSSAAFTVAAGVLVRGSRLLLRDVGVNRTRTGFLRILHRMGAIVEGDLEPDGEDVPTHEPVTDLDVAAGPLEATTVGPDEVPGAIDELPLVGLCACFAEGETVVRGAGELRVKESDRIAAIVDGLVALGGHAEATEDGFVVRGTGGLRGGRIEARGDHRIAMLGIVAGLASREGVEVDGAEVASVSYPSFIADIGALVP